MTRPILVHYILVPSVYTVVYTEKINGLEYWNVSFIKLSLVNTIRKDSLGRFQELDSLT